MTAQQTQSPFPSWRLVGLDIGNARIGVALSDPSGTVVSPLRMVRRQPEAVAIATIAQIVVDEDAVGVVAGLPLRLTGDFSDQTTNVAAFVERLVPALLVPVVTWDERYTTVEAERILRALKIKRDRWRDMIDAVAATVILQDYLDAHQATAALPPEMTDAGDDD